MITLPSEFKKQITKFAPLFSKKVFEHAKILLIGAILALQKRTVSSALEVVGLGNEKRFHKYHRVLSQVKWSCLGASKILLNLLVRTFCPIDSPIVLGIDETLERRRGAKIKAKGIYRDAVRSSKGQMVKSSGLRWISMMLLTKPSWASRVWGLPFFTVLAPSERYNQSKGSRHKTITDWAFQMIIQVKRWLPQRTLVVVADGAYSVINFLNNVKAYATIISPLRLDAQLFDFPVSKPKGSVGRPRKKGTKQVKLNKRLDMDTTKWTKIVLSQWYNQFNVELLIATGEALWYNSNWGKNPVPIRWVLIKDPTGNIAPKAILSTNVELCSKQIILYYTQRWSVEVTFQEVRKHLGVETQRQWSDLAIARTTPILMGLFSLITIWADRLNQLNLLSIKSCAWYQKAHPTFSDAIAAVRQYIWRNQGFETSHSPTNVFKLNQNIMEHFIQLISRAV